MHMIINRRAILAAAMAGLLPAAAIRAQENFRGLPMGVHGATLGGFPLAEVLRMLVEDLHLHYLELTPSQIRLRSRPEGPAATAMEARAIRAQLRAAGVTPSAWGPIALTGGDPDLESLFSLAAELGVANLTTMTTAEHLPMLEKLADQYGVRVAIHNNAPGSSFSNIDDVVTVLQQHGPGIGACFDLGNVLRASQDPVAALQKLEGRIYGIHLKSVASRDPDSEVVELGTGLLDLDAFATAVTAAMFPANLALSLEYLASPGAPVPGALRSLERLQAALNR
jgi:sugar phosphate isomerase/epimerase